VPTGSILAGAAELAAAPASIKWFAAAGVIDTAQSGTEPVQTVPTVLTNELTAADGSTIRLSLQPAQPLPTTTQSNPLAATQTYTVSVETIGGEATALSARLTISRHDAVLPAVRTEGPTVAPAPTSTPPDPVAVSPTPVTAAQPQLTTMPATVDRPAAGSTQPVVNPSPAGPAVAMTRADSPINATVQTIRPPATTTADLTAVSIRDTQPAAQLLTADTQLRRLLGADQTLTRRSTPAVAAPPTTAVTANAAATQPLASSGWTADQALVQLAPDSSDQAIMAQQPQRLEPQRLDPLPVASGLPTVELDLTAIQPQPVQVPAQLMEFVGTRFEIAPYQGLQYQQLLEQLFDKVEQARTAGNGLYNAHLDLNPPSLGKMFVNISVRGDAVAMQLAVAANVPKEQLKDSMNALRQSLEEAGLYVVELQIVEIEGDGERSGGRQQQEQDTDDGAAPQEGSAPRSTPAVEPVVKQTSPLSRTG
jgi:flagellar hook-length control protein FliK